ncbi:MAG: MATE family efflux transporter [Bacteroidota bacterium]
MKKLFQKFIALIFHRKDKTANALKQSLLAVILKGTSIVINLVLIPLTLNYLDSERYGLWLIISSIAGWFNFFDIGLGNGLRNKLTIALAQNNLKLAKQLVSTTYILMAIIFGLVLVVINFIIPFLNWQTILNSTIIGNNELIILAVVTFNLFIVQFVTKTIGVIFYATQKSALNNLINPISNVMILVIIFCLVHFKINSSIITLSLVFSGIPILIQVLISIYFFSTKYKSFSPSIKYFCPPLIKDIAGLGVKFFILQIGGMVLFSMSNIIITQLFGPKDVTVYNIAYRYFSAALMLHSLFLTPYWSAFTDSYARNDFGWIKKTLKHLNLLSLMFIVLAIGMFFVSDWVYYHWIGDIIQIPKNLSFTLALFVCVTVIVAPYTNFLAGVGKLIAGLGYLTIKVMLFFPLAYLFCKTDLGVAGIIAATIALQLMSVFLEPYQSYLIINGKAKGIWNK